MTANTTTDTNIHNYSNNNEEVEEDDNDTIISNMKDTSLEHSI